MLSRQRRSVGRVRGSKRRRRAGRHLYDDGLSLVGLLCVIATLGVLTTTTVASLHAMRTTTGGAGPAANAAAAANLANGMSSDAAPNIVGMRPGVACNATADAARSASNVYFANSGGKYPVEWSDLRSSYMLPATVTINPTNAKELDSP